MQHLRAQRLWQRLQGRHVAGIEQIRVIRYPRGNKRACQRFDYRFALVAGDVVARFAVHNHKRLAAIQPHILTRNRRAITQLAILGRVREFPIQPRCEEIHNPATFCGRWRVKRQQRLAFLIWVGATQPAEQGAHLRFQKVRSLVKHQQIMRPPLILVPVIKVRGRAKLNLPPVGHAPNLLRAVVAVAIADDAFQLINNPGELRRLAAQNQNLAMLRQRLATG